MSRKRLSPRLLIAQYFVTASILEAESLLELLQGIVAARKVPVMPPPPVGYRKRGPRVSVPEETPATE